ncbi:MAG: PrsW family glutamic-type intramembrane protease [Clostridia bacterium]|nr:PrsW family glutamic-type intramembrane protease [Clostridia bacterium]
MGQDWLSLLMLFGVSVVPGALWLVYFYRKDKYEAEPPALVAKVFFVGALMIIPAGIIETPLRDILTNPPSFSALLLACILGIGLIEEYLKYWAVRRTVFHRPEFNEPVDGVIYGISAGLGFAAFENAMYATSYGLQVGAMRAVLTSIVHASFSGIVGFAVGLAKFLPKPVQMPVIGRAILVAAVLHGLYDFLLITDLMNFYLTVLVVVFLYGALIARIRAALALSPFGGGRARITDVDDDDSGSDSQGPDNDGVS